MPRDVVVSGRRRDRDDAGGRGAVEAAVATTAAGAAAGQPVGAVPAGDHPPGHQVHPQPPGGSLRAEGREGDQGEGGEEGGGQQLLT